MSLAEQDKVALIERIAQLIRDDEPEAVLTELHNWAIRQAGKPDDPQWQRNRWRAFAYALSEANAQLTSPQKPAGPDFSPNQSREQEQLHTSSEAASDTQPNPQ